MMKFELMGNGCLYCEKHLDLNAGAVDLGHCPQACPISADVTKVVLARRSPQGRARAVWPLRRLCHLVVRPRSDSCRRVRCARCRKFIPGTSPATLELARCDAHGTAKKGRFWNVG